jgi:hypothetical protein
MQLGGYLAPTNNPPQQQLFTIDEETPLFDPQNNQAPAVPQNNQAPAVPQNNQAPAVPQNNQAPAVPQNNQPPPLPPRPVTITQPVLQPADAKIPIQPEQKSLELLHADSFERKFFPRVPVPSPIMSLNELRQHQRELEDTFHDAEVAKDEIETELATTVNHPNVDEKRQEINEIDQASQASLQLLKQYNNEIKRRESKGLIGQKKYQPMFDEKMTPTTGVKPNQNRNSLSSPIPPMNLDVTNENIILPRKSVGLQPQNTSNDNLLPLHTTQLIDDSLKKPKPNESKNEEILRLYKEKSKVYQDAVIDSQKLIKQILDEKELTNNPPWKHEPDYINSSFRIMNKARAIQNDYKLDNQLTNNIFKVLKVWDTRQYYLDPKYNVPKALQDQNLALLNSFANNIPTNTLMQILDPLTQDMLPEEKTKFTLALIGKSKDEKGGSGNGTKGEGTPLYDTEIVKILAPYKDFVGVIMADELGVLLDNMRIQNRPTFGFVLNTAPSSTDGEHWVAIYVDLYKQKEICFFNSFGEPPTAHVLNELKDFVNRSHLPFLVKFKINKVVTQTNKSNRCGIHAAHFLLSMFKGASFKQATHFDEAKAKEGETHFEKFGYL